MADTIELFMWGYQRHVQVSLEVTAKSLFDEIDKELRPTVFLLGVLVEDRNDRHPICLEPDDCGFSVTSFKEIKQLAQQLEKVDEEGNVFHSHPSVQQGHLKRISNRAYIEAIQKILNRSDIYGERERFVSWPAYVEGFFVFTILEVNKQAFNRYYSLTKTKFNDRFKISRSFIESTIDTYLKECSNALKDPDNAINAIERPTEELLREAGKQFMYTVSSASENFNGLHGLFDTCNAISSLKYEGAEGLGKLVIAKKDHANIRYTLQLDSPISLRDFRKVRKFLELSNDDSLIISDAALIYGLGELRGKYNPKSESIFVINFTKHYNWEVVHDNNSMMAVSYRQPNLPKERIDRAQFYSDLKRAFKDINNEQLDNLWDITTEATKQSHGTMLVISDIAKKEAARLGKQSFKVKPFKLTKSIINQITSIDGSVLVDRDSICHAIGVILDGVATDKGDSSRGARYNSAIRYYEYKGKSNPTVLVIISEDGMINLIPFLRPQIKHSTITNAIKDFEALSKQEQVDRKEFYKHMTLFEKLGFYLSQEECDTINRLRAKMEDNVNNKEGLRIVHNDLKPNKEMNDSYYIKE